MKPIGGEMQAQTATDQSHPLQGFQAPPAQARLKWLTTLSPRFAHAATAALACLGLAACQQGIEAAGRKVDAPGVPVALVGVEGAPAALQADVDNQVATQASARRIELVSGAEQPRYRLRGYLTAYPTDNGETALAFV